MKRIVTFDKANQPYGFVQLDANSNIPNNVTASTATSASYALTASYALNGGGGGTTIDTGSLATTGSNLFFGNQGITGSLLIGSQDIDPNVVVTPGEDRQILLQTLSSGSGAGYITIGNSDGVQMGSPKLLVSSEQLNLKAKLGVLQMGGIDGNNTLITVNDSTGIIALSGSTVLTGSVEITGSLTVNGNAIDRPYKVYTALLTQDGGSDPQTLTWDGSAPSPSTVIGVTYQITHIGPDADFTQIGAPDNNVGTSFVATGTGINGDGDGFSPSILAYNNGAPVVTVLENTLGGDVIYTYGSTGVYVGTLPITYTSGKLWFSATANNNNANAIINYYDAYPTGTEDDTIRILTLNPGNGNAIDTAMYNTPIEIRVYN